MPRNRHDPFLTIRTEGVLLPVDILHRISEGSSDLEGLSPESYHLAKNERINEVINRAWNRCFGAWQSFRAASETLPSSDAGTTLTRERWLLILFQELGYGRLLTVKAQEVNGKTYPISHFWHHSPIHLVSFRQDLDRRTPGMTGAARMSPHSLVQEFLSRSENHLWGILSNGLNLRLLRDNASLTRQAYVEFDLAAMMSGEAYADFVLLFLILHQSRLEAEKPEDCWLEKWSLEAQRRGIRALDQLRNGVEQAINTLGQGFLAHPTNIPLRQTLKAGTLSPLGLYQQLLRIVYRMIFLFVAEDRDLLLSPESSSESERLYISHYSLSRIRRMAGRLRGTRHSDLYQGLKITFQSLDDGEPALALAPLGGSLFSRQALSALNDCELANEALLSAVRHLSYTQEKRILRLVDFRNLGTEELGSVYESLLELHPLINTDASIFELKVAAGSERKTTGSYYTHSSLINSLLDSALQPVIDRALRSADPQKALLDLKVLDKACGSGHFLIAAAHRIAKHLAILRTGESEPPPEQRRQALRAVVSRCIYGVDINPLAVELCKVALWMETLDPGRPLGFLDHQIKCGNSLLGATPELLKKGIPNDAFKPLEGDDKEIASIIKRKNKEERRGQQILFAPIEKVPEWQETVETLKAVVTLPEMAVHEVREKQARYEAIREQDSFRQQKLIADLWTAAFFWPLTRETLETVPTQALFSSLQQGSHRLKKDIVKLVEEISTKYRFFHWHLEFPDVFNNDADTGFDCDLGNPPWERIKLQEKEFFAQRDPEIANAPNAVARKRLIAQLPESNPTLWAEFIEAKRDAEGESHFLRTSERYPLSAVGDINTYQIFAGLSRQLISSQGSVGIVVPSGIGTDDSNKMFFQDLLEKNQIISLFDFENRKGIFPDIQGNIKFCLLTLGRNKSDHFLVAAQIDDPLLLKDNSRKFLLKIDDISKINPNTLSCPIFRTKKDAGIVISIHNKFPILDKEGTHDGNPFDVSFLRMFDMANDSNLFKTREELEAGGFHLERNIFIGKEEYLPLYESKLVFQFNHRKASFDMRSKEKMFKVHAGARPSNMAELKNPEFYPIPRYWVNAKEVGPRIPLKWSHNWLVGYRRTISTIADSRSVIFTIFPKYATSDSIFLLFLNSKVNYICGLYASFNSFIFDYIARQKASGGNLNYYVFRQLPVLLPNNFTQLNFEVILLRVLELTYTAYDMKPFAEDVWAELYPDTSTRPPLPEPFIWDDERRLSLRCELDAIYFHLYGINREDADYILETFPIIKRKDMDKYGEYRTKRLILEYYDEIQKNNEQK